MANLTLPVGKFGVTVLLVIFLKVLLRDMIRWSCSYGNSKGGRHGEVWIHLRYRNLLPRRLINLPRLSVTLASHFIVMSSEETGCGLVILTRRRRIHNLLTLWTMKIRGTRIEIRKSRKNEDSSMKAEIFLTFCTHGGCCSSGGSF